MEPKLAASVANFAVRFCNEQDKSRSSVCSPLSAQCVLALTALGCAGASRAELLAAMDLRDDDAVRSTFSFITSTFKTLEGITLRIANKVYVTKNGTLLPAIQKDAEETFDSGLEQLDFTEGEASAARINKWVAEQTADMIKDIVSPGSLDTDTSLLLVNAIYFQGFWEYRFKESLTKNRTFHVDSNTDILVPMMYKKGNFYSYKHSQELKAKLLQMDYEGGQASMVIVLPDEVEGLGDVMQQLAAGHDLMEEIAELKNRKIDVKLPKFKVETTIDLKSLLPQMGIKSIFDAETSEIRMLTSNERLCVSQAIQKAVIEVDEAGTEATACVYSMCRPCSANWKPPKNPKFFADRPFLYVLTAQRIPVFMGVYQGSEFAVPGPLVTEPDVSK